MSQRRPILPIIVIAQFCCTSLWFASNAVMGDLLMDFGLGGTALGHLTAAVQFGFIIGTLVFALLAFADRMSPSKLFFICAIAGSALNLCILLPENNLSSLVVSRCLVGVSLAGIYPVGMKIAADYFEKGLGKSLGFLVGALVLGTAFPHFLSAFTEGLAWKSVVIGTSALAAIGGFMLWVLVPDGPYRKASQKLDVSVIFKIFRKPTFRAAAQGYFGHMWELYAFWAYVPVMFTIYLKIHHSPSILDHSAVWSFLIIGIGAVGCVVSGVLSEKWGNKRMASLALASSGVCCLVSPFLFMAGPILFLGFLLFWGFTVVADSPMFSTMVAQNAPSQYKGTALTIVNCMGYAISIVTIQLLNYLMNSFDARYMFVLMAIGPAVGLWKQWTHR
ncbi:MFS transporter [Echinicola rosea]|uniref:Membrane protein n=1 Tax=Echinicola rosea TaxID=1807691 RepID=A0ABQ1V0I0_9BACT|nr:MFS transporter [Echinicola rosea]GGF32561.1 membrane protein [Echinicola rosea]